VLVTSRSFDEYRAFFGLGDDDLDRRVLDCCAGASGFAAVLAHRGGRVVALDPAYADGADASVRAARDGASGGQTIIADHSDRFTWHWYGSPERRAEMRTAAQRAFSADVAARPGGYVAGSLPALPFADRAFDLALCSHLLFTWSDVLDRGWHEAALVELLRVAHEVRVFPLVVQGTGEAVPFLPDLLSTLRACGHHAETAPVDYEFQRGAAEMLVLRRG
jgi:SAM-dependent methyltransferase